MSSLPYPEARDDALLNLLPRIYSHRDELWAELARHRDDPLDHAHDLGLHLAARFPEVEGLAAALAVATTEIAKLVDEEHLATEILTETKRLVELVKSSPVLMEALTRVFPQLAKVNTSSPADTLRINPRQIGQWIAALREKADPTDLHLMADLDIGRSAEDRIESARQIVGRELHIALDPHDLSKTGWGVVFPRGRLRALRSRLKPLLEKRRREAGNLYKEITYRQGEYTQLLWYRHGVTPGVVDPRKMPYYLLLVGGPDDIPFELQYQLSVGYAVGRISFDDPEDYHHYALNVCQAEKDGVRLPRKIFMFSAEKKEDKASELMARRLIAPLKESLAGYRPGWDLEVLHGGATRQRLKHLLGGCETPGLLLVNARGYSTSPSVKQQQEDQGALAYQWEEDGTPLYFAGRHLPERAEMPGLISFLFASYSAGMPRLDNFPVLTSDDDKSLEPKVLAERPFVARLPQVLLKQGALAIIGHIDRGWILSLSWNDHGRGLVDCFEDGVKRLIRGERLGHALRPLYRRYSLLAASLVRQLDIMRTGVRFSPARAAEIGETWTAVQDARNLILLGDPAVYLLGQRQQLDDELWDASLQPEMRARILAEASAKGVSPEAWLGEMLQRELDEKRDK